MDIGFNASVVRIVFFSYDLLVGSVIPEVLNRRSIVLVDEVDLIITADSYCFFFPTRQHIRVVEVFLAVDKERIKNMARPQTAGKAHVSHGSRNAVNSECIQLMRNVD